MTEIQTEEDPAPTAAQVLVAEIEFLLMCGEGEGAIIKACGKTPLNLKRQLSRHGRHDLIPKIFEWDRLYRESSSR